MRLTDVLNEKFVNISLKGVNRDECIKELIDKVMTDQTIKSADSIFEAVLEREKIMTTGVGNGIAIPHCKHSDRPGPSLKAGTHPRQPATEALPDWHLSALSSRESQRCGIQSFHGQRCGLLCPLHRMQAGLNAGKERLSGPRPSCRRGYLCAPVEEVSRTQNMYLLPHQ